MEIERITYTDSWSGRIATARPCLDDTAMNIYFDDGSYTVLSNARFKDQFTENETSLDGSGDQNG